MKRAICNELFGGFGGIEGLSFPSSLELIRKTGFHGVEIAPHTLFGDFSSNVQTTLKEIKKVLDGEGVSFAGFHWLLVGPEGLHVSQQRAWDHIKLLADLAGELGGGPLTFGSPAQRASAGTSPEEGLKIFREGLSSVADYVESTGCHLLIEALPSEFTDVVNTLEEAGILIESINKPGIDGMFDFHNTDDENAPWETLILEHQNCIRHVHLNDKGGVAPEEVTREYVKAFEALDIISYKNWVSLEIFTVPENPEALLNQVSEFLDKIESTREEV